MALPNYLEQAFETAFWDTNVDSNPIANTITFDVPSNNVYKISKKDGRTAHNVHPGLCFEHFVLAHSVWLKVEYTNGTKKEFFV